MPPRKKTAAVVAAGTADDGKKKAKLSSGGNSKPDIAWLDSMDGRLFLPDEATRPPGFLYDIHYQWDDDIENLDLEFFERFRRFPNSNRCTGKAYIRDESGMYVIDNDWERLVRPCLKLPARGANVCQAHGAHIPAVVAAAKQLLAEASEVVALRLVGLTGTRDEENFKIRSQDRITAAQAVLDRAGVKGGAELEISGTAFEKVLGDLFGVEEAPNAPDA